MVKETGALKALLETRLNAHGPEDATAADIRQKFEARCRKKKLRGVFEGSVGPNERGFWGCVNATGLDR